jgi:hypothetical protein
MTTAWRKRLYGLGILLTATLGATAAARAQGVDREDGTEVLASDVRVLEGGLLREPNGLTASDAILFNVAGTDMGVTWGRWRQGTATSRAHCTGGAKRTDVRLRMSGLVPNGIYSVFYAQFEPDSRNPLCPGEERLLPVTSKDPEQAPDAASFIVDANGEADFQGRVEGCLFDSAKLTFMLIYHLDGMTYGDLPNRGAFVTQGPECRTSYGSDAMRQTMILQKW